MYSDADASTIVNQHSKMREQEEQEAAASTSSKPKVPFKFSTGISSVADTGAFRGAAGAESASSWAYTYTPPEAASEGPAFPPPHFQWDDSRYTAHVRAAESSVAPAGFKAAMACSRALREAFSGLFYSSA